MQTHQSAKRPILRQISSVMYPKIQRRQVVMNVFHPGCARPPRWSPPVLWRRFEDGLASISGRNIIKQQSETVIVWSTKILIAVYKKIYCFIYYIFLHTFVPCGRRIHGGSRPHSQNLQRRRRYFCPHKRLVKSVKEDIKRADVLVENCLVQHWNSPKIAWLPGSAKNRWQYLQCSLRSCSWIY